MEIKTNKELTEDFRILRKDLQDLHEHTFHNLEKTTMDILNQFHARLNLIDKFLQQMAIDLNNIHEKIK